MAEQTKTSPFVIVASIAVILFSLVGIAALTGLIPGRSAKPEAPAATAPGQAAATAETPAAPPQPAGIAEKPAAAQPEPAAKPARKAAAEKPAARPAPAAETDRGEMKTPAKVCADCGTISAIRTVEQAGEGTGLGAIAGGVAGALLGSQVGKGTGKDVATIAGAVGGGYAGHQIEKKVKTTKHYEIAVRMDDGSQRTVTQQTEPAFAIGDKVKIIDGALVRN